jgi:hypothetical protein
MKKRILAIDLDEVIRAKWLQFDRFYSEEFGDDGIKIPFDTYNLRNHYDFSDRTDTVNYLNEELPEDISPKEYIVDKETGTAPVDFMAFRKKEEKTTADELFHQFTYVDHVIEIFGSAPALYRGLDIDLRTFVELYKNDVEVILFSCEKDESISPSLFFLSKIRPNIRRFIFPEKPEDIWNEVGNNGIVITTDPAILATKGYGQKIVLLSRQHNINVLGTDYPGMNLQDFMVKIENNEKRIIQADEKFREFLTK